MKNLFKIAAFILVILAVIMCYLGFKMGGLPPAITGVGFLVIAFVFFKQSAGIR